MQDTNVFISTLFPVPPQPIIVILSGLNFNFCLVVAVAKRSHCFILRKMTYAILNWPSLRSSSLYSSPFDFFGIRRLLFFVFVYLSISSNNQFAPSVGVYFLENKYVSFVFRINILFFCIYMVEILTLYILLSHL